MHTKRPHNVSEDFIDLLKSLGYTVEIFDADGLLGGTDEPGPERLLNHAVGPMPMFENITTGERVALLDECTIEATDWHAVVYMSCNDGSKRASVARNFFDGHWKPLNAIADRIDEAIRARFERDAPTTDAMDSARYTPEDPTDAN
jgi:hypothetical protein